MVAGLTEGCDIRKHPRILRSSLDLELGPVSGGPEADPPQFQRARWKHHPPTQADTRSRPPQKREPQH